jgi:hypothetical protein
VEIKVLCPGCQKQLKAPAQMAGKQAQCPQCKTRMLLPEIVHQAEELVAPPPPPAPTPLISNLSNMLDEEDEYRLMPGPKVQSEPPRRPCPTCGEMIALGAAKCRFCDTIFDPVLRHMEKKKEKRSYSNDDSDLSAGEWVLAILCSGIGCIVGIVWLIQGKPKGGKMLGISLLFAFIWNVIRFAIEMSQQGQLNQ